MAVRIADESVEGFLQEALLFCAFNPTGENLEDRMLAGLRRKLADASEFDGGIEALIERLEDRRDRRTMEAVVAWKVKQDPSSAERYGDQFWTEYERMMQTARRGGTTATSPFKLRKNGVQSNDAVTYSDL